MLGAMGRMEDWELGMRTCGKVELWSLYQFQCAYDYASNEIIHAKNLSFLHYQDLY